jgi:hypothetical protein
MDNFGQYQPPQNFGAPAAPGALRHSGLGIASFVVSMLGGPAMFLLLVVAGVMSAQAPNGQIDEKSAAAVGLGLVMIGGIIVALIGAGLGIAGVAQKGRKKVFAVLGLVFNGLIVLGVGAIIAIGLAVG